MPLLTPPSPRPAAPARYGLASLSTLVVLGVAVAQRDLRHEEILLLVPSAITAWYGGIGPAILASVLSTPALDYFFVPPLHSWSLPADRIPYIAVFPLFGFGIGWLTVSLRRAEESLVRARDQFEVKVQERTAELRRSEEARQTVHHILDDGNRASEVIERVRALVRRSPPRTTSLSINDTVLEVMALVRGEARSARVTLESQLADDLPASPAASTVSSRDGFSRPWPTCRTGRGSVRSGRANGLQLWIEERVPAHWPSLGEVHHQVLPPRAARARRGARRGAHAAAPRAKVERP